MKTTILVYLLICIGSPLISMNKKITIQAKQKYITKATASSSNDKPLNMVLIFDRLPAPTGPYSISSDPLTPLAAFFASALIAKNCVIWVDAPVWNRFAALRGLYNSYPKILNNTETAAATPHSADLEMLLMKKETVDFHTAVRGILALIDQLSDIDRKIISAQEKNKPEDIEKFIENKKNASSLFQELWNGMIKGDKPTLYTLRMLAYHKIEFNPAEWDIYEMNNLGCLLIPSAYKRKFHKNDSLPAINKIEIRDTHQLPPVTTPSKTTVTISNLLDGIFNICKPSTGNDNWNVIVAGHGTAIPAILKQAASINQKKYQQTFKDLKEIFNKLPWYVAGIPILSFQSLLTFFNTRIKTNSLLAISCFAGGITDPVLEKVYPIFNVYTYDLILSGISNAPVWGDEAVYKITPTNNSFEIQHSAIKKYFEETAADRPFNDRIKTVLKDQPASLRKRETQSFVPIGENLYTISISKLDELDRAQQKEVTIPKDIKNVVLESNYIPFTLTFFSHPLLISSYLITNIQTLILPDTHLVSNKVFNAEFKKNIQKMFSHQERSEAFLEDARLYLIEELKTTDSKQSLKKVMILNNYTLPQLSKFPRNGCIGLLSIKDKNGISKDHLLSFFYHNNGKDVLTIKSTEFKNNYSKLFNALIPQDMPPTLKPSTSWWKWTVGGLATIGITGLAWWYYTKYYGKK